ncbi:HU family DNA-binding protein [Phocaeicola sp.]
MSDKITTQDIIDLLAEKHSMNKKDAELFVKGIFDLIEEALASEKYVKVKGLGTFKLTEVDSRESVNVNTGERIEIQGHTKISFTPDTSMKDLINKPFAHFETVILNENTNLADTETEIEGEEKEEVIEEFVQERAGEVASVPASTEINPETEDTETVCMEESPIEEITGEEEKTEETTATVTPEVADATTTEEEPAETGIGVVEETIKTEEDPTETSAEITEETATEDKEESPAEAMTIAEAAIEAVKEEKTISEVITPEVATATNEQEVAAVTPLTESITAPLVEERKEKEPKKGTPWTIIIAIILAFCIVGGIFWYMQSVDKQPKTTPETTPAKEMVTPKDTVSTTEQDTIETKDIPAETPPQQISAEKPIRPTVTGGNEEVAKVTLADTVEYDITGTKTNHILQEGESLIRLAVKFYGTKKLWPYIVQYNKSVIKDADRVPVGTTLRIPELTPKKH